MQKGLVPRASTTEEMAGAKMVEGLPDLEVDGEGEGLVERDEKEDSVCFRCR